MKILVDNIYLFKTVNNTRFKTILEWECLSVTEKAYKFKDLINDRVFWVDKGEIKDKEFGMDGYFPFECIYDKTEELQSMLSQLTKQ